MPIKEFIPLLAGRLPVWRASSSIIFQIPCPYHLDKNRFGNSTDSYVKLFEKSIGGELFHPTTIKQAILVLPKL